MSHQPTVLIDFDGVIHSYTSGWQGPVPTDPPEPGALTFIRQLVDDDYNVVVFTMRAETIEGFMGVERWLAAHSFPLLQVTNVKFPAIAYVDDRAVAYVPKSGEWAAARQDIERLAVRK